MTVRVPSGLPSIFSLETGMTGTGPHIKTMLIFGYAHVRAELLEVLITSNYPFLFGLSLD